MKTLIGTFSAVVIGVTAYTAFAEQDSSLSSDAQQLVSQPSDRIAPDSESQTPFTEIHSASNTDGIDTGDELPDLNEGSSGDSGLNIQ
jgi:hypothetical protein